MKKVHTFCRICEPACGLEVSVEDEQIIDIKPHKAHPVHHGFACHKGIAYQDLHNDPDRLTGPLKRISSKEADAAEFAATDWDAAFVDIAERIQHIQQKYGANAVAGYSGNPAAFNCRTIALFPQLFKQLGSRASFSPGTQDCANKWAGSEAVFGTQNLHLIPDLDHTDYFLCIGSNPRVSHMTFLNITDPMAKLRDIVSRGGKVCYLNSREIESASPATGEVQLIKPDTDVYFLASLLHELNGLGAVDAQKYTEQSNGLEALLDWVKQYPAAKTAAVTGVSEQALLKIAKAFAAAPAASIYMATGSNMQQQGTLSYWLLNMISLATGNMGKPGGNIYSRGFFPLSLLGKKTDNPFFDTPLGSMRSIAGILPGNLLADFIDNEKEPVRALIVLCGNPLLSMGGEQQLRKAFQKLELIVCIDIYRSATAECADYILPGTDWLERADVNATSLGFQPEQYAQYTPAVVPPRADCKDEWWIISKLQQALGFESLLDAHEPDSFANVDGMLRYSQLSVDQLKQADHGFIRLPDSDQSLLYEEAVQHADKKIQCFPPEFADALQRMATIFTQLQNEPAGQLKLISRRNPYMHNSWMHNVKKLKRKNQLSNPLWMNASDAHRLNLQEGQVVQISTAYGEIHSTLAIDDGLAEQTVAMTHGWGNDKSPGMRVANQYPGSNVNQLLPIGKDSYEPLSNMSFMTGVPVEVKAV